MTNPAATKPHTIPAHLVSYSPTRATCAERGVVEATLELDRRDEGGGSTKSPAQLLAAFSASRSTMAGNEIDKAVKSTGNYAVTFRFDDGSRRVFNKASPPTWRPGDRIKVIHGAIRSNC